MPQSLLQFATNNSSDEVLDKVQTSKNGLTETEAKKRQKTYGLNTIHTGKISFISLFIRQITGNPLLIILAAATGISFFLGERTSPYYILGIIVVSILLGFWNEYTAEKTIEALLKKIAKTALILRDGQKQEVSIEQITVGDLVFLSAGVIIPADLRLIEVNHLEINESSLTGEAKTVYKTEKALTKPDLPLSQMANITFMGTNVVSGSGMGMVIQIGKDTQFGKIAKSAAFIKPTTEFQNGLAQFGRLIINVIIILTIGIFAINALLGHKILESLIFALAIAVGLTPYYR
ncbi:cation-transporting P-type ATPase [Candidatus Roizmanbacteria bacterium]|nr:cation-transporting P-type ATPase [Candidatus Roizmanbacteria bacterium]